jgi:hypothetical protein
MKPQSLLFKALKRCKEKDKPKVKIINDSSREYEKIKKDRATDDDVAARPANTRDIEI